MNKRQREKNLKKALKSHKQLLKLIEHIGNTDRFIAKQYDKVYDMLGSTVEIRFKEPTVITSGGFIIKEDPR